MPSVPAPKSATVVLGTSSASDILNDNGGPVSTPS